MGSNMPSVLRRSEDGYGCHNAGINLNDRGDLTDVIAYQHSHIRAPSQTLWIKVCSEAIITPMAVEFLYLPLCFLVKDLCSCHGLVKGRRP